MHTLTALKAANKSLGHHWFSKDTMRFFGCKIVHFHGMDDGAFFITSEQYNDDAARLFTLRCATEDGKVETLGSFQGHSTLNAAKAALRQALDFHRTCQKLDNELAQELARN